MSQNSSRLAAWTSRIALPGAVLGIVVGVSLYMGAAATALHPDPQAAPSVMGPAPAPRWSAAAERARRIVRAALAEQNLPGVSVAVGVDGDIGWAQGFGWADIKSGAPVTPDTQFPIGTASEALTSAAVGRLLENGSLSLDEEIQSHVPQYPAKGSSLTLRQVMGHVAGVGSDAADERPLFRQRCARPVEALQHFAGGQLLFEPGTQYRRSNYGWILVSAAVEAAARQPFLTFTREQIFEPLGMVHTGADSATAENPEHIGEPEEDAPFLTFFAEMVLQPLGIVGAKPPATSDRATLYLPRSGSDPRSGVRPMRPHNVSCYAGAMAFFSTPSDLVRFGLAIDRGTLLQPATVQSLQAAQRLASGQTTSTGLGWRLQSVTLAGKKVQAVGQDGEESGGKVVSLMTFPEPGIVIAVTSNVVYADTSALALRVAEAFADGVTTGATAGATAGGAR